MSLAHILGLDSASGYWYLFFSGVGGDAAIIGALLAAPLIYVRHHTCTREHCWRLGHIRHQGDRSIVLCHQHHDTTGDA